MIEKQSFETILSVNINSDSKEKENNGQSEKF